MGCKFALDTYFKYMIADATDPRYTHTHGPASDTSMPLYLGVGPEVPRDTFVHDGHAYEVTRVLPVDDGANPFPVPVVLARRLKRGN